MSSYSRTGTELCQCTGILIGSDNVSAVGLCWTFWGMCWTGDVLGYNQVQCKCSDLIKDLAAVEIEL